MTYFYVCDRCGYLDAADVAVPEDGEWTCVNCSSQTAWEFEKLSPAIEQSEQIKAARKLFTPLVRDPDAWAVVAAKGRVHPLD